MDLVRKWLSGRLRIVMEDTNDSLERVISQAMGIARAADDHDLYYIFDIIDDQLQLAVSQAYGTVAACRKNLEKALQENGSLPFTGEMV